MVSNNSSNNYATARFIVSGTAGQGNYTTIAAAITAASSGNTIFIMPGSYTEDLTLKAGVDLASYDSEALTPNVTITGKCSFTAAGTVSISGIRLQTNSDFALAVTGSAASIVNLTNCFINCLNNTGISFTSSSSSAQINLYSCQGDLATTGIAIYTSSSAGVLFITNSNFINSGSSTTASSNSAGTANIFFSIFTSAFSCSSTGAVSLRKCSLNLGGINTTVLTTAGTAISTFETTQCSSGTASAISVGTGTTVSCSNAIISSSNTNAITGAGTLAYSNLTFTGSSSTINTSTVSQFPDGLPYIVSNGGTGKSTQTAYSLVAGGTTTTGAFQAISPVATGQLLASGGASALPAFTATPQITALGIGAAAGASGLTFDGTNLMGAYTTGTWTPGVQFGGGTTGITYSSQAGTYWKIGKVVFLQGYFILSNKGSSFGIVQMTGLPFTSAASGAANPQACQSAFTTGITFSSTYSFAGVFPGNNNTLLSFVQGGNGVGQTNLFESNLSNTSEIDVNIVYFATS